MIRYITSDGKIYDSKEEAELNDKTVIKKEEQLKEMRLKYLEASKKCDDLYKKYQEAYAEYKIEYKKYRHALDESKNNCLFNVFTF